ncbi:sortase [Georgenia faecalis]|uniref:sortase n=1 Tax=Georgenia faecalis TaxID=2483799 RepID=UPI000FDB23E7|nr:sortase [Georgenia faecalis]
MQPDRPRRLWPALVAAALTLSACSADGVAVGVTDAAARVTAQEKVAAAPVAWPAADPLADIPLPARPTGEGVTFASLRVPRWGADYDVPVTEGISDHVLDTQGMGRFPWTAMPGEEGNFALAGHRTDGSRPLARIDELILGDELVVTTAEGAYTYAVSGTEIVTPDQVRVVEPNPSTGGPDAVGRLLTLVSCHPWDSSEFRYIVYAELTGFAAA